MIFKCELKIIIYYTFGFLPSATQHESAQTVPAERSSCIFQLEKCDINSGVIWNINTGPFRYDSSSFRFLRK